MKKQVFLITAYYPEGESSFFDRFKLPEDTAILTPIGRTNIKDLENNSEEIEIRKKKNYFLQSIEDSDIYFFAPVFKNAADVDKENYFQKIFNYFSLKYHNGDDKIEYTFILHAQDIYTTSSTKINSRDGKDALKKLNPHELINSSEFRLILFSHTNDSLVHKHIISPLISNTLTAKNLKEEVNLIFDFHSEKMLEMVNKDKGIGLKELEKIKNIL